MKTWKSNLEETKQRYINWWNHKGIILNMWEHFQEGVQPHAEITPPAPAKDLSQKWFDRFFVKFGGTSSIVNK